MAKISVIIPCYNAGLFLNKCLESFVNQNYKDFNLILIDDCSTDNTPDLIRGWIDRNILEIIYIRNEINSGPAISRNKGIGASTGEWIAFCDSDDWYERDFLSKMVSNVESHDADMIACGFNVVVGNRTIKSNNISSTKVLLSSRESLFLNIDSLCCILIKRDIIKAISQPDLRNGEDMAIIPLLLSESKKIVVLPDCLYNYYTRQGSASLSPTMKVVDSLVASFEHIYIHLSDNYKEEKEFIGVRNLVYGGLLNLFKCSYDTRKASAILTDFESKYPNWYKNRNIRKLPITKRVFVAFAKYKCFLMMRLFSLFHQLVLK